MSNFAPPKFIISNNTLTNIGHIEAAREVIENSPLVPAYERQFKKEAIARTVHYATALEGNPLNLTEVKRIIEGMPEPSSDVQRSTFNESSVVARERDVQEVINYRQDIEYIHKWALTE